jgi:hypothetical protein
LSEFGHLAQQVLSIATNDADDWGEKKKKKKKKNSHFNTHTIGSSRSSVRATALLLSAFVVAAPNVASSPDALSAAASLAQMERDSPDFAAIVAQVAEAWKSNVRTIQLLGPSICF